MNRTIGLLVSAALLAGIYWVVDPRRVLAVLVQAEPWWTAVSVAVVLPITWLRAVRLYWVSPPGALPGTWEALRLTLVSGAVNLFVPAKAGDLVKSYFIATRSQTSAGVSIAIVVYERLCDTLGLVTWCVLGWLVGRPEAEGVPSALWWLFGAVGVLCAVLVLSERAAVASFTAATRLLPSGKLARLRDLVQGWPDLLRMLGPRRTWMVPFSVGLWLVHLFQLWLFTVALGTPVPFAACVSLSSIALVAGQLPLTLAGIGARDMALVVLLANYLSLEQAAAMGVLVSTRNLLPPLLGLPIMRPYMSSVVDAVRRRTSQAPTSSERS